MANLMLKSCLLLIGLVFVEINILFHVFIEINKFIKKWKFNNKTLSNLLKHKHILEEYGIYIIIALILRITLYLLDGVFINNIFLIFSVFKRL
jgi:hypothetical protein